MGEQHRREQKMEEWNHSLGTSTASTTSEDSFKEEEFEKYQKRLSREAEKRKDRESCEQVVKDLGQLRIAIAKQGEHLNSSIFFLPAAGRPLCTFIVTLFLSA
jgi:hypothetical protein